MIWYNVNILVHILNIYAIDKKKTRLENNNKHK